MFDITYINTYVLDKSNKSRDYLSARNSFSPNFYYSTALELLLLIIADNLDRTDEAA